MHSQNGTRFYVEDLLYYIKCYIKFLNPLAK